jgi:predicted naringenin-chalcone synthase
MTLDKNVPVFITRVLEKYLERLAALVGRDAEELKRHAYFAIHPGGPKILSHIQQLYSLNEQQLVHSVDVLQNFGNMSSATLPHIWEKMLRDLPDEAMVVSLAFGPGLSIAGALFQKRGS